MEMIYNNFDKLEITFKGKLPEKILEQLKEAKQKAQEAKTDYFTEIGKTKMSVKVSETGAKGGYAYRFDTGKGGEVWMAAQTLRLDNWAIRVSVKSLALMLYGYDGVIKRLMARLEALEATGEGFTHKADKETPYYVTSGLEERISRFDYCFDFRDDEKRLSPKPDLFLAHSNCKKRSHWDKSTVSASSVMKGDKIQTITLGSLPGRQATLYNKTKEITDKGGKHWWQQWQMNPKKYKGIIWRVEVRAGKDELDKWNLKNFEDFNNKAGDVIISILQAMRYTEPNGDLNRSRWPTAGFWEDATNKANKALAPYISNAKREKVFSDNLAEKVQMYRRNILGNAIGLTAAEKRDLAELPAVLESLNTDFENLATHNQEDLMEKFEQVEKRFNR